MNFFKFDMFCMIHWYIYFVSFFNPCVYLVVLRTFSVLTGTHSSFPFAPLVIQFHAPLLPRMHLRARAG